MAAEKKEINLYNGEVKINFYPNSHTYKLDGKKTFLPSVTSIAGLLDKSQFLIPWAINLDFSWLKKELEEFKDQVDKIALDRLLEEASRQHTIKKEAAADTGTTIHEFAEKFGKFKMGLCDCPEISSEMPIEVKNGIKAFLGWFNDNHVEFIDVERVVYSKKNKYVGLLDAVAKVNGVLTIIDYKSSKYIYNEHLYQVSAYQAAYNEESPRGEIIENCIILKFGKEDGLLEVRSISFEDNCKNFNSFLGLLAVKNREKELNKR